MQYRTLENFVGLVLIVLIGYGCVHFKTTPTKSLSTKLAVFILTADEVATNTDIVSVATKSIDKAIAFVEGVGDGEFSAKTAFQILKTLGLGGGVTLGNSIGPSGLRAINLLINDMYVDLKPAGEYLPAEINKEFAVKFVEVLKATSSKLKG